MSTLGMLDCIGSNVILHIPHSSTNIHPKLIQDIGEDFHKLTDHATDKIFDIDGHTSIIFPYSRFYCDVERFEVDPMEEKGMGFYYTKNIKGETFRNEMDKPYILEHIYKPHHEKLNKECDVMMEVYNSALIVDCHSFGNDIINNEDAIEICIGFNENTNKRLIDVCVSYFSGLGYTVGENNPYVGAMMPIKYANDDRVQSVMIEINKSLYMENGLVVDEKVDMLHKVMKILVNNINMCTLHNN